MERLTARDRATVVSAIEQPVHESTVATRKRKPLRPNPIAPWVLRVSHLRVDYEVKGDPDPAVTVRAIGIKVRERVTIGGVEVDLS